MVVGEVGDGRGLREKKAADGADGVDGGVQGGGSSLTRSRGRSS